jgi:hypothetical protein
MNQPLTLAEFWTNERISKSAYYNYEKIGKGVKTYKVGRKRLIDPEDALEWRRQRRAESAMSEAVES